MDPRLNLLLDLPGSTLLELANALTAGSLRFGISTGTLAPFAGSRADQIAPALKALLAAGATTEVLGRMCHVLHEARRRMDEVEQSSFPALSGPEVPGTPVVSTPMMVRALFGEARRDVIIASYVFHKCTEILQPLAEKLDSIAQFRVRIIVDLSHQRKQPAEPLPVVANRFRADFLATHWPGTRKPELWHDPRVFKEDDRSKTGVMHAKAVVIDSRAALITSANFTEAAQNRNIEAGLVVRQERVVSTLRGYFDGLIETGTLARIN